MIAHLSGKVLDKNTESVIIEAGGVGYRVFITVDLLQKIKIGESLSVWTYFAVRENSQDLYGFENKPSLEMFELLLTISGVGPKSALSILDIATVETLTEGIQSGDADYLSKISGISHKRSEKIVVALKDKLGADNNESGSVQNQNSVAIDALVALGYSERESRSAIQKVEKSDNPEEMVKNALKKISGN